MRSLAKREFLLPVTMTAIPLDWFDQRSQDMERQVESWCQIPSGSESADGLKRMEDALGEAFRLLPCTIESVEPRPHGPTVFRASCRPDAPVQVLLVGHRDTVYGDESPFKRCDRPRPGILRGPGVADMKGGLVVLLNALLAYERFAADENLGWEVLIVPDEEIGSPLSRDLLQAAAKRHSVGLVFEPAVSGALVRGRMGTGVFRAVCRGRSAHAGRALKDGRNAILGLAGFLVGLEAIHETFPGILLNVGTIRGGGTVNVVPDHCEADINLRAAHPELLAPALAWIESQADRVRAREGFGIEFSGKMSRPPKVVGPVEERLFAHLQEVSREIRLDLAWTDVGGASDGNLLSEAGLPTLDGLGVRGGALHSPEEFLELDSLAERAWLSARLLASLPGLLRR